VVLAIASIIGGKYIGVRDMIESAQSEMNAIVGHDVFTAAWPTAPEGGAKHEEVAEPGEKPAAEVAGTTHGEKHAGGGSIAGKTVADTAVPPHETLNTTELLEEGEHQMHSALAGGWAWAIALGLGFLVYMNGYVISDMMMKIPPVRWINVWLKNRMYFDELYKFVFVGTVMFLAYLSAAFDRLVVDGIVNAVASVCRQFSALIGLNDKYVVDGAVNGAGALAQSIGQAVRTPQTGRVRLYVTVLMCVIAVSIAGAIVVVLSR